MKLVLYSANGLPHRKNYEAVQRMCKSCMIDFELCNNVKRLEKNDYDILMSCHDFINPEIIPENIKIIMGPQFFIFPEGQIIGKINPKFSNNCVYNILSPWIKNVYLEFVEDFIIPMKELPFSVDTNRFKPLNMEKEYDCIVYIKRRTNDIVLYTINLLNQKSLKYKIFRYGSYKEEDYIDTLNKSNFMITLDAHESQGFALEEAMSSGIPLLVFDAQTMYDESCNGFTSTYEYLKPKKLLATSVPYWSNECGIKITNKNEMSDSIDKMINGYKNFTPRDYIIRTLSDKVCMERILNYFNITITNDIFIITSVINTGNVSWSYTSKRSIFNQEQRFNQTIETIESIKKYSKSSKILLVEGGKLDEDKINHFKNLCDYIYYLGEDKETEKNCILSNCKGLGDSWLVSKGLQYMKDNNIPAINIYKISGRYRLNKNYNRDNISIKLPTFKNVIDNVYCTFFYSVPYSYFEKYCSIINKVIEVMKVSNNISIETLLPSLFEEKFLVETIGAEGLIAVDTSLKLYSV